MASSGAHPLACGAIPAQGRGARIASGASVPHGVATGRRLASDARAARRRDPLCRAFKVGPGTPI
jgi:hypothetical protein